MISMLSRMAASAFLRTIPSVLSVSRSPAPIPKIVRLPLISSIVAIEEAITAGLIWYGFVTPEPILIEFVYKATCVKATKHGLLK